MSDVDTDNDDNFDFRVVENGHISDSNTEEASGVRRVNSDFSDSEADDNDSQNTLARFNSMSGDYDPDIPTAHEYLGKLNPIRGYSIWDDGMILNTYGIFTNTLVFPGFTMPLMLNNEYEHRIMQKIIREKNKIFILLCANFKDIYEYGVVMEIYETSKKKRSSESEKIYLKARARQRCMKVPGSKIENVAGRIKQVTVQVLGEPSFQSPLYDSQLLALRSKRKWSFNNLEEMKACQKIRQYHAAQFPFPIWIYNVNEIGFYMDTVSKALEKYNKNYVPMDPEKLSYWFVQNYPLTHSERLQILKAKNTLERLKLICSYIELERIMCCGTCEAIIADPSTIFMMSKDGMQSNYVNPGGNVFETATVHNATGFYLSGRASKQFSWFPGYAWTIMQCKRCNQHLGWKFSSANLNPKEFYGLAKSGFKILRVSDLILH